MGQFCVWCGERYRMSQQNFLVFLKSALIQKFLFPLFRRGLSGCDSDIHGVWWEGLRRARNILKDAEIPDSPHTRHRFFGKAGWRRRTVLRSESCNCSCFTASTSGTSPATSGYLNNYRNFPSSTERIRAGNCNREELPVHLWNFRQFFQKRKGIYGKRGSFRSIEYEAAARLARKGNPRAFLTVVPADGK